MTRPAFLKRTLALVALATLFGYASGADNKLGAGYLPPGDFDPGKALELIFPGLEIKGDAALWEVPEWEADPARTKPVWGLVKLEVLDSLRFRQADAKRIFLVCQSVPAEQEYNCRNFCAPDVGAATFTNTENGWRLDAVSRVMGRVGGGGKASKPKLVKLGPERYGVVLWSMGMGQGSTVTADTYFLETGTSVKEVLQITTYSDNGGSCGCEREVCDPDDPNLMTCFEIVSTVEFVPGKNAVVFDLKVTQTDRLDDTLKGVTLYSYTDGMYRETSP